MSQTKRIHEKREIDKNTLQQRIQVLEEQVKQLMSLLMGSTPQS